MTSRKRCLWGGARGSSTVELTSQLHELPLITCYLIPGLNSRVIRLSLSHAVDLIHERGKEAISEGETELKTIRIAGLFSKRSE